jgi:hypothetical protein
LGNDSQLPFVIRNHAKLKLALGDGWLCLHGRYTSKCRERAERLAAEELPDGLSWLRKWHAEGVAFKFKPFAAGPTWPELEAEASRLVEAWGVLYLAVEERRLNRRLAGFADYLARPRLLPNAPLVKNLLLALRDRLQRGAFIRPLGDYPRGGLLRALPCLLGLTPGGAAEAGRFLPRPAGDPSRLQSWEAVYSKWWSHYA